MMIHMIHFPSDSDSDKILAIIIQIVRILTGMNLIQILMVLVMTALNLFLNILFMMIHLRFEILTTYLMMTIPPMNLMIHILILTLYTIHF